MKRFLAVVVVVVALVFALLLLFRYNVTVASSAAASLLSSDTVLFLHLPDAVKNREDWHKTELYALYREPTVQEFLRKPIARIWKNGQVVDVWRDVGTLRLRDSFVATNTFDMLHLVAGFEFGCEKKQAESIIESWKSKMIARSPATQRSTIDYEKHSLDIIRGETVIASTFVGNRFLAASTVEDLKTLLDRIDHRTKTPTLESDENYRAAMKQMPMAYAWLFYLQPKQLAQKLAALRAQDSRSLTPEQQTILDRIQSFSHAMVFQGAKIKDVDFMAMPQLFDAKLTRDTLSMTSADTFLYIASLINLEQQIEWIQHGTGGSPASPAFQQINTALTGAGVTEDDWKTAFSNEISIVINWPANSRVPNGVATLGVRDLARANKIVHTIAAVSGWQSTTRNQAQYYTAPTQSNLLAITPTLAVNDRFVVFGLDPVSVDRAIETPAASEPLPATEKFKSVSKLVPEPGQMFAYVDLANVYSRLDKTFRPILQMSAALIPSIDKDVDLTQLPDSQVVTRHLSPAIASQSYVGSGYRSESIGTITITQTASVAAMAWLGTIAFKSNAKTALPTFPVPSASPSASVTNPTPTP